MNETPEDPRLPDEGGGDDKPPYEPAELPPLSPLGDLPPLDDAVPEKRRLLSGGRLAAAAVVVLALIGGTAFALTSGGDDDGDDGGIASVDGSEGDGDSDGSSGSGDEPSEQELQDAMLEFAQCMRDHGVDMPDPEFDGNGGAIARRAGPDGGGPSEDEWEAADEACSPIMEGVRGEMTPPSPEEIAEMQDQMVAMAQCMRDKGYDFPDPEVSGDGGIRVSIGDEGGAGLPMDDEQFMEDQDECHEEAGLEGPGRGMRPAGAGGDS